MSTAGSPLEVFVAALRLGCISFGGPVAHLAQFQHDLVDRRRWVDQATFVDLVAFCQFLPGPSSSQVCMCLGLKRAGIAGMMAAGIGFLIPAATILFLLALGITGYGEVLGSGWIRGLHTAVVGIVAWAVWGMAQKLCPDRRHATIALSAAALLLVIPNPGMQFVALILGALWGWAVLPASIPDDPAQHSEVDLGRRLGLLGSLTIACIVLVTTGMWLFPHQLWEVFAAFFRVGFLVFGGGHVVLPMLADEVVATGWISQQQFMTGYGLTQAMPGPIFTLSMYLGTTMFTGPLALAGGLAALGGIYLPSFFLVSGLLPVWDRLRLVLPVRKALAGIAAAVVGLLLAALYTPIFVESIQAPCPQIDLALALGGFCLLGIWRQPAWLVVIIAALAGTALEWVGVTGYA
jgi:chromate transporter